MIKKTTFATSKKKAGLVVQRIEQAFPKRSIGVRFPSGLQRNRDDLCHPDFFYYKHLTP